MNEITRIAKNYLRPYRTRLSITIIVAIVASLAPYCLSFLGKVMVDNVLGITPLVSESGEGGSGEETLQPEDDSPWQRMEFLLSSPKGEKSLVEKEDLVIFLFFCYLTIHFSSALLNWFCQYNIVNIGQSIIMYLRRDLHEKMQTLQMTFFDQRQTGELMSRILDDVDVIQHNVTQSLVSLATNTVMLLVGIVIIVSINFSLSLIALATLPFYAFSYHYFIKRIRPINKDLRQINSKIYALVQEKIQAVKVIKCFAEEKGEVKTCFHIAKNLIHKALRRDLLAIGMGAVAVLISGVGTGLILYGGLLQVKAGRISLGGLLFFYSSVAYLFSPVILLTNLNIVIEWILTVARRIFEVLDEEVKIKDLPSAVSFKEVKGDVTLSHVSLKYGTSGNFALKNISFSIPQGTQVSLVGPSGSGKSTLVNLLLRLYEPQDGYILVDGHNIRDFKLSSVRSHIAMVHQKTMLFSGTIAENIRYGRFDASNADVEEAAEMAELHEFIYSLPEKYETEIGEGGFTLSGGQRQRLALARAILTKPSILILDDSTSSLDSETEAKIQATLQNIMKGRTCFTITHRISTAMSSHLIIVLKDGEISEMGTHEELIYKKGVYYDIFYLQSAAGRRGINSQEVGKEGTLSS